MRASPLSSLRCSQRPSCRLAGSDQQRPPARRRNLPRNNGASASARSGHRFREASTPPFAAVGRRYSAPGRHRRRLIIIARRQPRSLRDRGLSLVHLGHHVAHHAPLCWPQQVHELPHCYADTALELLQHRGALALPLCCQRVQAPELGQIREHLLHHVVDQPEDQVQVRRDDVREGSVEEPPRADPVLVIWWVFDAPRLGPRDRIIKTESHELVKPRKVRVVQDLLLVQRERAPGVERCDRRLAAESEANGEAGPSCRQHPRTRGPAFVKAFC